MLLNGGVAVDGSTRVLGRRTVELFASNRLPACSANGTYVRSRVSRKDAACAKHVLPARLLVPRASTLAAVSASFVLKI